MGPPILTMYRHVRVNEGQSVRANENSVTAPRREKQGTNDHATSEDASGGMSFDEVDSIIMGSPLLRNYDKAPPAAMGDSSDMDSILNGQRGSTTTSHAPSSARSSIFRSKIGEIETRVKELNARRGLSLKQYIILATSYHPSKQTQ